MFKKLRLVIKEVIIKIRQDDLTAWASQLTFYIILAIFPFIIFLVEMINRIEILNVENLLTFTKFFPLEVSNLLELVMVDVSQYNYSTTLLSITAVATLWAASKGFMAITRGLNMAYDQKETRGWLYLRGMAFLYTIVFMIAIVLVLIFVVFGQLIIDGIFNEWPLLESMYNTFTLFRYLIAWFFTYWFFIAIYNASPNRRFAVKEVSPGAMFTSITWLILSTGFSIYINASKNFAYIYGSLTGIIILLLWLFFSSILIMVGGELNAIYSNILDIKLVNDEIAEQKLKVKTTSLQVKNNTNVPQKMIHNAANNTVNNTIPTSKQANIDQSSTHSNIEP